MQDDWIMTLLERPIINLGPSYSFDPREVESHKSETEGNADRRHLFSCFGRQTQTGPRLITIYEQCLRAPIGHTASASCKGSKTELEWRSRLGPGFLYSSSNA